jgi:hypothetical protein
VHLAHTQSLQECEWKSAESEVFGGAGAKAPEPRGVHRTTTGNLTGTALSWKPQRRWAEEVMGHEAPILEGSGDHIAVMCVALLLLFVSGCRSGPRESLTVLRPTRREEWASHPNGQHGAWKCLSRGWEIRGLAEGLAAM